MKTTDTLARRLRWAKPQPTVKRIVLTEPDFLMLEAIDRHGPLPTNYLRQFAAPLRRGYSYLQNRLTEFYNGDERGPYLTRPQRQFDSFNARYQHIVYDLAPRTKIALEVRAENDRFPLRRSNDFVHDLMGACVGASIELTAPQRGLRYISRCDILNREQCPEDTRRAPYPLALPLPMLDRKALIPDDLFGLEYPDGGRRYFAVEIDRNSESLPIFERKIAAYSQVLGERLFERYWGLPNLHVLAVTTSRSRLKALVNLATIAAPARWHARFKFTAETCFGTRYYDDDQGHWRVPKNLLARLIDEPWEAAAGPINIAAV